MVTVRGKYAKSHTSPNTIEAQGTAAAPVFIQGGSFTATNELSGSYVIVERGAGVGWVIRDTGSAASTHHIVVRDTELVGGGIGIGPYLGAHVHDIVVLRTSIHDVGDMKVKTDVDSHCVSVGVSDHVWILDSIFTRCSGDGVQVNGGRDGPKLHHVYIARNVATNNRQSGFWAKQSADVVMSSNVVSNMRPGSGGPGNCIGAQYGAARIVFLNNRLSDCEYGIGLWSYDEGAPGGALIAGNVITNIHRTTTDGEAGSPWAGGAAIFAMGGVERVIVNNTIVDVDGGIQAPQSPGILRAGNNIIVQVKRAAMSFEGDGSAPKVESGYTLFDTPPTVLNGGAALPVERGTAGGAAQRDRRAEVRGRGGWRLPAAAGIARHHGRRSRVRSAMRTVPSTACPWGSTSRGRPTWARLDRRSCLPQSSAGLQACLLEQPDLQPSNRGAVEAGGARDVDRHLDDELDEPGRKRREPRQQVRGRAGDVR